MIRVKIDVESEYRIIFEIGQWEHPFSCPILEKILKKSDFIYYVLSIKYQFFSCMQNSEFCILLLISM